MLWQLRSRYPDKYLIVEHLSAHPWITTTGNFDATWYTRAHHEMQRALSGEDPVARVASFLGWDGAGSAFHEPWTQGDGRVYINLPKLGVVMLRLK